jgi:8-oxo-dGTP diphosphatase
MVNRRAFDEAAIERIGVMKDFSGAKIALICGDELIAYKRDYTPGIPFPGTWDLPGGGREGNETPVECALRELDEEFSLRLPPERVIWLRRYDGAAPGDPSGYFLAGAVRRMEIESIRFGDEGQYWQMMDVNVFLTHPEGVPFLQQWLRDYLALNPLPLWC